MSLKIIVKNKRAFYDYSILETFEAGIELKGTEVKSLREGKAQISEGFISIENYEAWLRGMHIPHYKFGNTANHEENRKRKLLLHKKEIAKVQDRQRRENLTIIPIKVYFKNSRAKIEIALAKGKNKFDKRQDIKSKEDKRTVRAALS